MTGRNVGTSYTYGYDAENHLLNVSGATTASFVYDADGVRVKGTTSSGTIAYVGNYFEWKTSTSDMVKYYYASGRRVAMRTGSNAPLWLVGDHLGSTSKTTDYAGTTVMSTTLYSPWGIPRYTSGTSPTKYTFTGQYSYTSEFGLLYYGARFYEPYLNRWTQPDSIVPESSQGVQAWDRYCFVSNNPLTYIDPTGKYGVEVHYWMTYNMVVARVSEIGKARGWSDQQIKQVASSMAEKVGQANMSVDHEKVVHGANGYSVEPIDESQSSSNPIEAAGSWINSQTTNDAHKMEFEPALDLVENAKDLESLGEALHSLQDFYAHRMKPHLEGAWAGYVALNHTFTSDDLDKYHYDADEYHNEVPETYSTWDEACDFAMHYWTEAEINSFLDKNDWSSYDHKR